MRTQQSFSLEFEVVAQQDDGDEFEGGVEDVGGVDVEVQVLESEGYRELEEVGDKEGKEDEKWEAMKGLRQ